MERGPKPGRGARVRDEDDDKVVDLAQVRATRAERDELRGGAAARLRRLAGEVGQVGAVLNLAGEWRDRVDGPRFRYGPADLIASRDPVVVAIGVAVVAVLHAADVADEGTHAR